MVPNKFFSNQIKKIANHMDLSSVMYEYVQCPILIFCEGVLIIALCNNVAKLVLAEQP
jgi:hypothetical protein